MVQTEQSKLDSAKASWVDYWHMLWVVAGLSLLALPVERLLGYRSVGFVFLGVLLALGSFFTTGPMVWGALLSALAWDLLYIPPRFTWTIHLNEDTLLIVAYFLAAIMGGALTWKLRASRVLLGEREARTQLLYELSAIMHGSGTHPERFLRLAKHLERTLGLEVVLYLCRPDGSLDPQGFGGQHPHMLPREEALARVALQELHAVGWGTTVAAENDRRLVLLRSEEESRHAIGILACRPLDRAPLGEDQERLLAMAVQQLSLSLDRALLQRDAQRAEALQESERLHQALLDGISHELRTPLTTLLGSAAALRGASGDQQAALLEEVSASGARLDRSVGNLLDLSRMNAGRLQLKKDWQDPGELLRLSLASLKPLLRGHPVTISLPADLPLALVDHRLFEHAFANILLNAVSHSPAASPVMVTAEIMDGTVKIRVIDQGPGIPVEVLPHIFERFFRAPGEREGGTGLGLSIARAIVLAHGGDLVASNRLAGGAEFCLSLPIPAQPQALEAGA